MELIAMASMITLNIAFGIAVAKGVITSILNVARFAVPAPAVAPSIGPIPFQAEPDVAGEGA